jgi:hypothetical protein
LASYSRVLQALSQNIPIGRGGNWEEDLKGGRKMLRGVSILELLLVWDLEED